MTNTNQPQQDEPTKIAKKYNWSGDKDYQLAVIMLRDLASRPSPHALVGDDLFGNAFGEWLEANGVKLESNPTGKLFGALMDLNVLKAAINTLRSRDIVVAELRGRIFQLEQTKRCTNLSDDWYEQEHLNLTNRLAQLEGIQKGKNDE